MSEVVQRSRFGLILHSSDRRIQDLQARAQETEELRLVLRSTTQAFPDLARLMPPFVHPHLAGDREFLGKALIYAAEWGMAEVVVLLLNRGADVNFAYPGCDSALIFAVCAGCIEVLDILLKHGAQVDFRTSCGKTSLWLAAAFSMSGNEPRSAAMVQRLVDAGAFVDTADQDGITPLMTAAGNGYVSVVRLLLSHGADKRAIDSSGKEVRRYARGKTLKKLLV